MRYGLRCVVAGCVVAVLAPAARGQSLDSVVEGLLGNNCADLGFEPSGGNTPDFGDDLVDVCSNGAQGTPSSSGGGAASPQGSALSAENSLIQQRLERAKRKKTPSSGTGGAASTAFRWRTSNVSAWQDDDQSGGGTTSSSSRGFNIFGSATYESLDRSLTPFEDAYDSSVAGGAVGFDYQFNESVVAGFVASYRRQEGDFQTGGDLETTTIEPTVFVSVLPSDQMFLQLVAGYGDQSSDVARNILYAVTPPGGVTTPVASGTAGSSGDASQWLGAAQFGYDFAVGRFTFGPRAGVNYNRNTVDGYTESGTTGLELRVQEREVTSFQGVLGFFGSAAFSAKSAVLVPQLGVEYVHEFEDDASIVTAQFAQDLRGPAATTFTYQTNVPDSDFYNAQLGLGVVFARGIQLFVNVRGMFGNDLFDSTSGVVGVRFEL